MIDLSIIIVAHNVKELMEECLTHVQKSKDVLKKEIIFVDNGSSDGTSEMIKRKFSNVRILRSEENLGFIRANNLAYEEAKGKYILMLNSDAFLGEKTLQTIIDFMDKRPDCGVVGCRQVGRDGTLRPSARYFPTPWRIFLTKTGLAEKLPFWRNINDMNQSHDEIKECDWVCGCCLFVRKNIVESLGFFLRSDFFMYNDDNDLCLRVKRNGWKVFFYPENVIHLGGATNKKIAKLTENEMRSENLRIESEYIYFRKNYNMACTLFHAFLIMLFDLIQMTKRVVLFKKHIDLDTQKTHLACAYKILRQTYFGKVSIH